VQTRSCCMFYSATATSGPNSHANLLPDSTMNERMHVYTQHIYAVEISGAAAESIMHTIPSGP
jgi:hypothetical protein